MQAQLVEKVATSCCSLILYISHPLPFSQLSIKTTKFNKKELNFTSGLLINIPNFWTKHAQTRKKIYNSYKTQ